MPIVPRWEWRTFAADLGEIDRRFDDLVPSRTSESDEGYLLSLHSDASVKLRDDQADVKVLEEVDAHGLQRWRPVLKAALPLSLADRDTLLRAVGVEVHADPETVYTLERFLEELVRPNPGLRAVRVGKRRRHYMIGDCMVERSEIRIPDHVVQTIALESEDPAHVLTALRDLGLGERRNVSLPRELKALTGFDRHRYATIDVGTNSVKFHIGVLSGDGRWETISDRAVVTRLGEGLDQTGVLNPEPIERTVEAIVGMAAEAGEAGVEAIAAVGTAGLRMAPNRQTVLDAVRDRTGIDLEVIDGEEEARLAYLAATSALGIERGDLAVFDTGGGSSQFTFGDGARVDQRFSVNVGAARFTERFGLNGPVSEATLREALDAIDADLAQLDGHPRPDMLVGMGGAVTNLTAVKHGLVAYDADVVQGTVLDATEIDRQIELYRTRTPDERRRIAGLQPARAEVILAGACIVRTILAKLGKDQFTVSDRALRHGLLAVRFGP